jgi:hypothetical protein
VIWIALVFVLWMLVSIPCALLFGALIREVEVEHRGR